MRQPPWSRSGRWESSIMFLDDCSMREILCGKKECFNTLSTILKLSYGRSRIRSEYWQILDYLFDKKMLKLRNSVAHGISTNYDYLSLAFVGVMVQTIWNICTNDVILNSIQWLDIPMRKNHNF